MDLSEGTTLQTTRAAFGKQAVSALSIPQDKGCVHRLFAFPYVNNLLKHPLKSAKNLYLVKGQIHEGGMILTTSYE